MAALLVQSANETAERQETRMEENIVRVGYQGKEIILVATAHVLRQSAELIKEVIEREQPDSVCIELDEQRYQNLLNPTAWQNTDIVTIIRQKKVGLLAANLFLASYQKRIAKNMESTAGLEMIQAIESAKQTGATLVLADRSIQVTFLRLWRKTGFAEKFKLFYALIFSDKQEYEPTADDIADMMQADTLSVALGSLQEQFPSIARYILWERNAYLAHHIKNAPGSKIVAVLGGAHVAGIQKEIEKTQDMKELDEIPPKSKAAAFSGWLVPLLFVGLFGYTFAVSVESGLQGLATWIMWTSGMAALFTAMAMAHPLSILTSLLAAPFTTLNPLIACGWLTGLVEAMLRKPRVEDINNVAADITTIKGIFKNRLLKTILIIMMANIGSSLGFFLAGFDLFKTVVAS